MLPERIEKVLNSKDARQIPFSNTRIPTMDEYMKVSSYWIGRLKPIYVDDVGLPNRVIKVSNYESNTEDTDTTMHEWIQDGMDILTAYGSGMVESITKAITWFCQPICFTTTYFKFDLICNTDIVTVSSRSKDIELLLIRDMLRDLISLVSAHSNKNVVNDASELVRTELRAATGLSKSTIELYDRLFDYSDENIFRDVRDIITEKSETKQQLMLIRLISNNKEMCKGLEFADKYPEYTGKLYGIEPHMWLLNKKVMYNYETFSNMYHIDDNGYEDLNTYLIRVVSGYVAADEYRSYDHILYNDLSTLLLSNILYKNKRGELIIYDSIDVYTETDYHGKCISFEIQNNTYDYDVIKEVFQIICDVLNELIGKSDYNYAF